MGKGKSSTIEYDVLNAITIETGKYISISLAGDSSLSDEEKKELLLVEADLFRTFKRFSPEDVAIIQDAVGRMSPEAREVLEVLFKPTSDQLDIIGSKVQGRINKKRLVKYIDQVYEVSVDKVLREIRNVLRSMAELRHKVP